MSRPVAHGRPPLTPSSPLTPADDDASKAVIRSVCVILDAFHFPLPADMELPELAAAPAAPAAAQGAAVDATEAAAADVPMEEGEEEQDAEGEAAEDAEAGAAGAAELAAVPAGEVYRMLAKRAVPELHRIMVDKDTVRAPVALAGTWRRRCACPGHAVRSYGLRAGLSWCARCLR